MKAFLLGCIEPDRNPATYLKGSIRCQWLRGHNYRNARALYACHFQPGWKRRKSSACSTTIPWQALHYTTDAFTYAHNDTFPTALSDHREYEAALQDHFLEYMKQDPKVNPKIAGSVMEAI